MAAKLKRRIFGSSFIWIGLILFILITIFSFRKKRQVEHDTEKQVQLMVKNISSNNINLATNIFFYYKEQLEHLGLSDLSSSNLLDNFINKDSTYRNIEIVDKDNYQFSLGISSHLNDTASYIQYVIPIQNNRNNEALSLKISLDNLHKIIAENSNFSYSYVTISKSGTYIYHPDESKIGKNIQSSKVELFTTDNEKDIFNSYSDYLGIDVYSYFEIIDIDGEQWCFSSNTPGISFDDFVSNVSNAFMYISISALFAFVLISFLGFLLWKREFMKKQAVQQEKISLELINEQHKQQMLTNELEQLKSGLNPHFLFNSLSSLRILVTKNPDEAKNFATSLSKLYRYLLQQQNINIISLKEELNFTKNYIYLQQIRFGDRIVVTIDIEDTLLSSKLPPVSLQLLVENCIKHTKMSTSRPLNIKIYSQNNYLIVKNNYNPIDTNIPSGKGLNNLNKRYSYLTSDPCSFSVINNEFVAKIPLL